MSTSQIAHTDILCNMTLLGRQTKVRPEIMLQPLPCNSDSAQNEPSYVFVHVLVSQIAGHKIVIFSADQSEEDVIQSVCGSLIIRL